MVLKTLRGIDYKGKLSRSWKITKLTFHVMKADKELIIYPILAIIFSLVFIVAMLFPTILVALFKGAGVPAFGVLQYFLLFVMYLGLAFISTFFNFCVVYTAKRRFANGDATFGETIKYAFSKIHLIFMWSLVVAIVGVILRALEAAARKAKGAGKVLFMILRGVLSLAWNIVTLFVIPAMVYDDATPIDAIKKSIQVLKKTWGESLTKYIGLNVVQGLINMVIIIPVVIFAVLAFFTGQIIPALIVIAIGVFLVIFVTIIFGIANSIFDAALYEYASTGKIPSIYTKEMLDNAFKNKKE